MNKVILLGRLTHDPEPKATQSGVALCRFCIAVSRRFDRSKTDFINCVAWRAPSETVCRYFKKGDMIGIIGSMQNSDYTDSDGAKRRNTVVNVDEFYFAGAQKKSTENNTSDFSADFIPDDGELPWDN